MRSLRPCPSRQRGAALLTAMIIVTLVATLAAAMVWQQWRAVQVEAAERARAQSAWILSGALDFAKLILKEDKKQFTALTEPWATPLAEARLSTFLAVDKSNADDGPEAFLSGDITDAQSRYNLWNLIDVSDKTKAAAQVAVLGSLCESAGIEAGVAQRIATAIRAAAAGTADSFVMPERVSQLTWFGIDAASVEALQPYVVILQAPTPINVNTAGKEVIAAVAGVDTATAEHLVQLRQRTPFTDITKFNAEVKTTPSAGSVDVISKYFEVHGRLRLIDRVLVERSLLYRAGTNQRPTVVWRERVSSLDQSGS